MLPARHDDDDDDDDYMNYQCQNDSCRRKVIVPRNVYLEKEILSNFSPYGFSPKKNTVVI